MCEWLVSCYSPIIIFAISKYIFGLYSKHCRDIQNLPIAGILCNLYRYHVEMHFWMLHFLINNLLSIVCWAATISCSQSKKKKIAMKKHKIISDWNKIISLLRKNFYFLLTNFGQASEQLQNAEARMNKNELSKLSLTAFN